MIRKSTYMTAEDMLTKMVGPAKVVAFMSEPIQPRSIEAIAKECDEAWYCNAIRGANLIRKVAYAKMTGEYKVLPCVFCRMLGIGDYVEQAHKDEVTSEFYHEYTQDYTSKEWKRA